MLLPGQQLLLPQLSVKGYRELLRRLRQPGTDADGCPAALLQQAKARALAHLQRSRDTERLDPRRAFARLRQRLLDTRQGLRALKEQQKQSLRASYAAFREQRAARRGLGVQEAAVLGSDGLLRAAVLGAVGLLSKGFMQLLNSTEAQGREHLLAAMRRPRGQALLTVSSHTAALDDPLLLAALMPLQSMGRPEAFRWGTCATDRCFTGPLMAAFFRAGKTLPLERGGGLEQPGMRAAEGRLAAGDWVHTFPEGSRSRDGRLGRLRRGTGHLVASCAQPPIVLPLVHSGMEGVLPRGAVLPRVGQRVRVLIGEPIAVADLFASAKAEGWSQEQLSSAVTRRVAARLHSLKARLESEATADAAAAEGPLAAGDPLLPLVEAQLDALSHSWRDSSRRQVSLGAPSWAAAAAAAAPAGPSVRQRLRQLRRRLRAGSPMAVAADYFARLSPTLAV